MSPEDGVKRAIRSARRDIPGTSPNTLGALRVQLEREPHEAARIKVMVDDYAEQLAAKRQELTDLKIEAGNAVGVWLTSGQVEGTPQEKQELRQALEEIDFHQHTELLIKLDDGSDRIENLRQALAHMVQVEKDVEAGIKPGQYEEDDPWGPITEYGDYAKATHNLYWSRRDAVWCDYYYDKPCLDAGQRMSKALDLYIEKVRAMDEMAQPVGTVHEAENMLENLAHFLSIDLLAATWQHCGRPRPKVKRISWD